MCRESEIFSNPNYMAIGSVKGHVPFFLLVHPPLPSTFLVHLLPLEIFHPNSHAFLSVLFSQAKGAGRRVVLTESRAEQRGIRGSRCLGLSLSEGAGSRAAPTEPSAGRQGSGRWMGIASPLTEPARATGEQPRRVRTGPVGKRTKGAV